MKLVTKLLGAAGTLALTGLAATPAFAVGTTAGTVISNQATLTYQVSGATQLPISSNTNNITVDEKVVFTVGNSNTSAISVTPGQQGAVTSFTVTNSSNNATLLEFGASAAVQTSGNVAPGSGTSAVTVSNLKYYATAGSCGTYSSGATSTAADFTLAAGATECVYVLADIPNTATSGQNAGVDLTVTAESAAGVALAQSGSSVGWTSGTVQIVFADAAGNGSGLATGVTDVAYDGKYTALNNYQVSAPILTVTKISWVSADGIETSNFKAIPGATLNYCVIVANSSTATASATNIAITDTLPGAVSYVTGSNKLIAPVTGTAPTTSCSGGTAGSDAVSGTVSSGTIAAALAPGQYEAMWFQTTIN